MMNDNKKEVMKDFVKHGDVSEETINKYKGVVSDEVIEFWKEYGYGSFYGGFIQSINPDDYIDVMQESINQRFHKGVPLFVTGMCDLILWDDGFLRGCFYRYGAMGTVCASLAVLYALLKSQKAPKDELYIEPYLEAKEKYGEPEYGYGFGYVPLLPLGGKMSVGNLEKLDIITHIRINATLLGQIDYGLNNGI